MSDTIVIKRKKVKAKTLVEKYEDNFEQWVAYWRENLHRFIVEYLGLTLYDFQKVVIYSMSKSSNYIYVRSRGLAKSTIALLFAVGMAILYPGLKILVVCPVKSQSKQFLKKINDFLKISPNLRKEINEDEIKLGTNESSIPFHNGSEIITAVYSENSLGIRAHILIVDEFVRTEKKIINRVFIPMLSNVRHPEYLEIPKEERAKYYKKEDLKQLYLSSIRRADEWSYESLVSYIENMTNGNQNYAVSVLPYQLGVKNGFISKRIVEQAFRDNMEYEDILRAEYMCIPERGTGSAFYQYHMFSKNRKTNRALWAMSDEEFIEYKDNPQKWAFYQEKFPNEIRLLCMDIALVESENNDNTAFWVLRLIPDGGHYRIILAYGESMHGLNSIIQNKRMKQLFYEMSCDYCVMDTQGNGIGVYDIATAETYDEERGLTYPAWMVINQEDVKMTNRVMDSNAVPLIYSIKTSLPVKSAMFGKARDVLTSDGVDLLTDVQEAIDYLNTNYGYYKIEDSELKSRLLNPFVQTDLLIMESINLEQVPTQGYINLKEKPKKRKDRTMSFVYGIWIAKQLEQELQDKNGDTTILDYIFTY